MLRQAQNAVSARDDDDARSSPHPEPELKVAPKAERVRVNFDDVRAEVQRKFAAKIDLGLPDPDLPEPTPAPPPKVERRRDDILRATVQKKATVRPQRRSLPTLPSWRMRPSRIALVFVALLAGGAAAYLATQREPAAAPVVVAQPAVTQVVPEARTQILVAKQTIGVGQRLTPDSVEWQDWPQGAVLSDYVTAAASPQATADMAGSMARFEFFPGEPIRKDKLAPPGQGLLSAILDSGMRGVSVTVSAESASGGFIVPDDHVDVVVARTANAGPASETILQNVRVLAINDRLGGNTGTSGTSTGSTDPQSQVFKDTAIATLELDSQQAEVIIGAATTGKLSLVLRSLSDFTTADRDLGRSANEAIRLSSPFWLTGSTIATVH